MLRVGGREWSKSTGDEPLLHFRGTTGRASSACSRRWDLEFQFCRLGALDCTAPNHLLQWGGANLLLAIVILTRRIFDHINAFMNHPQLNALAITEGLCQQWRGRQGTVIAPSGLPVGSEPRFRRIRPLFQADACAQAKHLNRPTMILCQ